MTGRFCARCGQRNIPPYPTTHELVADAFGELSGWDGRFASTLRTLIRRPGELTIEFLKGRRARYISPVRLYLTASLVYFVTASAAPNLRPRGEVSGPGFDIGITGSKPGRVAAAAADARDGEISAADRREALKQIKSAPRIIQPVLRRAVSDPEGFKRGMVDAMPRVLFALVPVFAGIVALFYRGRKYPEHLYFSLHLHTFVFLALALAETGNYTGVFPLAAAIGIASGLWIAGYALFALRRVYERGWIATVARSLGIALTYFVAGGIGLAVTIYWAARYA